MLFDVLDLLGLPYKANLVILVAKQLIIMLSLLRYYYRLPYVVRKHNINL